MLLAVDVGNTNIGVAAFEGDHRVADWRVRTDRDRTSDENGLLITHLLESRGLSRHQVRGVAIACVVPTMEHGLSRAVRRYFQVEPFVVNCECDLGFRVLYHPSTDVGADRLVNAAAVKALYGVPAVVVDFGTATTFDAVSRTGDYLGGAITPGIGISTDALFRTAARLYRVQLAAPGHAVGTTTVESVQSGVIFGAAGQVDALVRRIRAEIGEDARVVATGGLARLIERESQTIQVVDPWLTLQGIRILYERNQAK